MEKLVARNIDTKDKVNFMVGLQLFDGIVLYLYLIFDNEIEMMLMIPLLSIGIFVRSCRRLACYVVEILDGRWTSFLLGARPATARR